MRCSIYLNGLSIAEAPDIYNFKSLTGHCCYEIFSSYLIIQAVKENASRLKIDVCEYDDKDLPRVLSKALESDDFEIKAAAEEIAADFGRRLGLIVYTVKCADEATKAENSWHSEQDWQTWRDMNKVYLAGGLANGALGDKLRYYAQVLLNELNIPDIEIIISRNPSYVQMIGCARMNNGDSDRALVLDFGHSFIKSGIAFYNGKKLSRIEMLPKIKSEHMGRDYSDKNAELRDAMALHDFIADVISRRYLEYSNGGISDHIVISIANKVIGGKIGRGGCYYKLMLVSDEYERYLERCVSERVGRDIKITLIHDGGAAAMCISEEKNAVMIALGTAFGVGYHENVKGLRNADFVEVTI